MRQQRPDRTLGGVHDAFWAYCAEGEMRLQRCATCGHWTWPTAPACEACKSSNVIWTRVSGRGTLLSWCIFERDYYRGALPMPWETILVALEEGPLFIANPLGFGLDAAKSGMPLKLAFLNCEDSAGAFRLPVFEQA